MGLRLSQISRSARFGLFYAAFYLGFGAFLPFMPTWFEGRGLSSEMIGLAGAAAMAGRVIAAPIGAAFADRAPRRRDVIIVFSFASVLLFAAHIPASEPWLIVVLAGVAGGAFTGVIPIIDSFAVREAGRRRFEFGPPRAVGSSAFVVANIACGGLISLLGHEAGLYWTLTGAALALLASLLLPEGRRVAAAPSLAQRSLSELGRVLTANGLPLAFLVSALVQGAHGFYYSFSAVSWGGQGISQTMVGVLWAVGVTAEIAFFWATSRWLRKWSPTLMLAVGAGVSVLRWALLALAPPLWLLFPLQLLHAFSFGATYLGFLRFAAERTPDQYSATAQALNSALSGGIVLAAATYASGLAHGAVGAAGFVFMSLPAALGLFFAWLLSRREKNRP